MLRRIANFVLGSILITAVMVTPAVIAGEIDTHYKMNGIVKSVHGETVCVVDAQGEEWGFVGDGYTTGESVEITFFTACTDNTRYDDEIDKVKKL